MLVVDVRRCWRGGCLGNARAGRACDKCGGSSAELNGQIKHCLSLEEPPQPLAPAPAPASQPPPSKRGRTTPPPSGGAANGGASSSSSAAFAAALGSRPLRAGDLCAAKVRSDRDRAPSSSGSCHHHHLSGDYRLLPYGRGVLFSELCRGQKRLPSRALSIAHASIRRRSSLT